jgi:hypothetical protein
MHVNVHGPHKCRVSITLAFYNVTTVASMGY